MNLYIHFPFCRSKCSYCALYSRVGSSKATREDYCRNIATQINALPHTFKTIYFGGGSPGFCDLSPILRSLEPHLPANGDYEFTVELNPHDATPPLLQTLKTGGVNRISLGVQSLDDTTLKAMNRNHTANDAAHAFAEIRNAAFTNAGIDLIAGWPKVSMETWRQTLERAASWDISHCSVYTLIHEPKTKLDLEIRNGITTLPSDDEALSQIDAACEILSAHAINRYEISNHSKHGYECKHNLAVWHGEDYIGLGSGAYGRMALTRTFVKPDGTTQTTLLTEKEDALERAAFQMRLAEGFNLDSIANRWKILAPEIDGWCEKLHVLCRENIVRKISKNHFALTNRGFEVCDAVLDFILPDQPSHM